MAYLDDGGVARLWAKVKELLNGKVSTGRKINGKALTADITLSAGDVSAIPASPERCCGRCGGTGQRRQGTGRTAAILRG